MPKIIRALLSGISVILKNKILRAAFSLIMLLLVFRSIDVGSFLTMIMSPMMLPAAVIATFLNATNVLILSLRWSLLFFPSPTKKQLIVFARANFIGAFYSAIFPTSNGGDFLKWTLIEKTGFSQQKRIASVFVDRFVGLLALFLIGSFAIILASLLRIYQVPLNIVLAVVIPSIILTCVFIYSQFGLPLPGFFPQAIQKMYAKLLAYNKVLRRILLISIASQLITGLSYFLLGMYWGQGMSMAYIFIFLPIISLLLLLPISIGGIGYKEAIFLYFFSKVGIDPQSILLITTSVTLSKAVIALIGWMLSTSSIKSIVRPAHD